MSLVPLSDAWRSATSRLILIYGSLFAIWCIVLLGIVQWESTRYLSHVIDQMLVARIHYLEHTDPRRLADTVGQANAIDIQGFMWVGLFDPQGRRIAGNIAEVPRDLAADGSVGVVSARLIGSGRSGQIRAHGIARQLPDGRRLVVAKASTVIDGLTAIIYRGLLWGLSLTLLPGVLGGLLIARGPARRIRAIQQAMQPIHRGDLSVRLPVSRRGDEVDLLAATVNRTLGEVERLLGEVKGVTDNIAHDLRTPLTRMRTRLHRLQQQFASRPEGAQLDECVGEIDTVLTRFRALLRVSELEDRQRSACFSTIDLAPLLHEVHAFYAPLAEDRGQTFDLAMAPLPAVHGDRHLLFEALANLVSNAIKFTPDGGTIRLRAATDQDGNARLEIADSGPGIAPDERQTIFRRFYRVDQTRAKPGCGLGLAIVSAIVRLHGYTLQVGGDARGAVFSLLCPPAAAAPSAGCTPRPA
ncbi:HAMP domain-containing histidine kinase [Xanthomonas sp. A2111]|uniref:histidine kinase n=1 Tax=Xanthomonas hawaiiensis TaxID=3003247 RepID=A0ABU2I2P3_9XANT|nr:MULTISPECIES: HAMP domain-containing sensor histidine kinase [unclassified Xanthomonas]MBO9830370.1 HAMP domain-containing histidine kinase [Xanthomonas sp. A2111]MBO9873569.1 HAMP domain-containing histidine kinase [Xanthomonas sp. D-93]MDS9992415.1 HAMP domain-containing sensor histidine kinase [Xanthomonas sp. A2111]WNH44201.1 HAMP domain-containing sensor histidine kinase [Xanthomonas sp. A6251]